LTQVGGAQQRGATGAVHQRGEVVWVAGQPGQIQVGNVPTGPIDAALGIDRHHATTGEEDTE
jgi:hypothetical protein